LKISTATGTIYRLSVARITDNNRKQVANQLVFGSFGLGLEFRVMVRVRCSVPKLLKTIGNVFGSF